MQNFFEQVKACIDVCDSDQKVIAAQELVKKFRDGVLDVTSNSPPGEIQQPGKPVKLKLVHPRQLPKRSIHTDAGRAALVHAIAHIEYNAINLALDAVFRFRDLPLAYYGDWLQVADEEAYHFSLVNNHLRQLGHDYGDFDAHNGLWEMAVRTSDNVLLRMALVPRVMEARGLDVTPGIIDKFSSAGDEQFVEILKIILRDEIGHVEIGTKWFYYFCDQHGLSRQGTFEKLMKQYMTGRVKLPFHYKARKAAGFSDKELQYLEGLCE